MFNDSNATKPLLPESECSWTHIHREFTHSVLLM